MSIYFDIITANPDSITGKAYERSWRESVFPDFVLKKGNIFSEIRNPIIPASKTAMKYPNAIPAIPIPKYTKMKDVKMKRYAKKYGQEALNEKLREYYAKQNRQS